MYYEELGLYISDKVNIAYCIGKVIKTIEIKDDALCLIFNDDVRLKIYDDGQSCCESRYMTCDDDLSLFEGSNFADISLNTVKGATNETEDDIHEIMFLDIHTSIGVFTICTHNEHNGWYGGFNISTCLSEV